MRFAACIALCLALAVPVSALAEEQLAFQYSRSPITLLRNKAPIMPPSLPWLAAAPADPAVTFDVEVRDGMTMYNQKGWFSFVSPETNAGVLMAFTTPAMAPIVHTTQYAPLDILMIDNQGHITQIIPNLKLAELQQEIMPDQPVMAFLLLKGGVAQTMSINPGDTVKYSLFKKSPLVIGGAERPAPAVSGISEPMEEPFETLSPSAYTPPQREPKDSPIK